METGRLIVLRALLQEIAGGMQVVDVAVGKHITGRAI